MLPLETVDFVILCGGLGKRLRSVTGAKPKVLAEINGKPFLNILIEYIASQGGRRFILCTGYGAEEIESDLKKTFSNLEIIFSREEEPLGTGGAIKKASGHVESAHFIAMNGDCFCTLQYQHLVEFHKKQNAVATIAVNQVQGISDFGTIEFDQKNSILAFKEKVKSPGTGYVNTGTYCFNRDVFSYVETAEKFSIEYDFFPKLVNQKFLAYIVQGEFIDIGTPERFQKAQEFLKRVL